MGGRGRGRGLHVNCCEAFLSTRELTRASPASIRIRVGDRVSDRVNDRVNRVRVRVRARVRVRFRCGVSG